MRIEAPDWLAHSNAWASLEHNYQTTLRASNLLLYPKTCSLRYRVTTEVNFSLCDVSSIMEKILLGALLYFLALHQSNALECYVCDNQEGNIEKCLNTIKTCEQGQDVCFSEIKWGSTPYWSQGAKKQYYISKRCSTKKQCERTRQSNMKDCTRIWYQDWKCSECCQGDRCNYYIISDGTKSTVHISVVALAAITYFLVL